MRAWHAPQACKHLDLLPVRKLKEILASAIKVSVRVWTDRCHHQEEEYFSPEGSAGIADSVGVKYSVSAGAILEVFAVLLPWFAMDLLL